MAQAEARAGEVWCDPNEPARNDGMSLSVPSQLGSGSGRGVAGEVWCDPNEPARNDGMSLSVPSQPG